MAKEEVIVCDTNILLAVIKNHIPTVRILSGLTNEFTEWRNMYISIITYGEILPVTQKKERKKIIAFLRNFTLLHIDKRASLFTKELMNESYYYAGLLADGLIGASAITNGIPIWTYNKKDFQQFKGIRFFNPR
ncbi:MAG: PIN domain-containing protein [Tunicatimonas sp.]|uniref:type II toxin-antitoxin system VapC family toxin n=1 Tax=Tunicatimonas sp. TaxID=1940096 RepID=UPI003C791F96